MHTAPPHDPLSRLDAAKRRDHAVGALLGDAVLGLFQQQVSRRHTKFAQLADLWCRVVPESALAHCALETYHRGRLTVLVDTAPHLYELKQLLLAGLEDQLLLAGRAAGLRKIALKRGTWYDARGEARF